MEPKPQGENSFLFFFFIFIYFLNFLLYGHKPFVTGAAAAHIPSDDEDNDDGTAAGLQSFLEGF